MALRPKLITVTNTTAGTRTQVTASHILASWVTFESVAGTSFYIGDVTVSSTVYMYKLAAGGRITIDLTSLAVHGPGGCVDLSTFYVDSGSNGDKCQVSYFERAGTA